MHVCIHISAQVPTILITVINFELEDKATADSYRKHATLDMFDAH